MDKGRLLGLMVTKNRHLDKWKDAIVMSRENNLSKTKNSQKFTKQFIGLKIVKIIEIAFFRILNGLFGQGDDLVKRMKLEEQRIAEEKKLSELISKLPSGILVSFDGTDHYKLTDDVYEQVCKATKLIPQRAIMGANFLNFRAHELYTINGNQIDETFVKWDQEKNKCFAGFTVSGNNVGVDESITISGEALSFLSTGIDTRVYFIKNF